jgi:hypothetical protein
MKSAGAHGPPPATEGSMPRWVKFLFMGLGAVIMAGTIWYFVYASQRAAAAQEWPVAEGHVVANRVDISESTDDDGDRVVNYDAVVTFEYPVGGRRYRSERLFLNAHELFETRDDADAFLSQYRPGTALDVSYNPEDPTDAAVYIEGPPWLVLLFTGMGAIFFAAGWFFPADSARPGRRPFRFKRD